MLPPSSISLASRRCLLPPAAHPGPSSAAVSVRLCLPRRTAGSGSRGTRVCTTVVPPPSPSSSSSAGPEPCRSSSGGGSAASRGSGPSSGLEGGGGEVPSETAAGATAVLGRGRSAARSSVSIPERRTGGHLPDGPWCYRRCCWWWRCGCCCYCRVRVWWWCWQWQRWRALWDFRPHQGKLCSVGWTVSGLRYVYNHPRFYMHATREGEVGVM